MYQQPVPDHFNNMGGILGMRMRAMKLNRLRCGTVLTADLTHLNTKKADSHVCNTSSAG